MTAKTSRLAIDDPAPKPLPPAGTPFDRGEIDADLSARLAAQTSPQANAAATPNHHAPAGTKTSRSQRSTGTHSELAAAVNFPGGHRATGTQGTNAAGGQAPQAISIPAPIETAPADEEGQLAANALSVPMPDPLLADPFLALAADVLDDLEAVRIANENRLRQLTRDEADKDGIERGFGLDLTHPAVARFAAMVRTMKCDSPVVAGLTGEKAAKRKGCCLEHDAERNLAAVFAANPLSPWAEAQKGVGVKQGARLLGAIGDPYMRPELVRKNSDGEVVITEPARPRLVSELWAYCGLHVIRTPVSGHVAPGAQIRVAADGLASSGGHTAIEAHRVPAAGREGGDPGQVKLDTQSLHAGVAPRRTRGQRSNWDGKAKMRVYLVAESCIKQRESPYRPVYDKAKATETDSVHAVSCPRCGPKGSPAQPGSPLKAGHQHARAMRKVMKEILRDLWAEAKRIHEAGNEKEAPA